MNEESRQGPKYEVNVEGVLHPWPRDTISAAEISQLGGWPLDQGVIEVDLKTQEERTLGPDEAASLQPGKGFGRKISWKRG
jgi:hypothetical protein